MFQPSCCLFPLRRACFTLACVATILFSLSGCAGSGPSAPKLTPGALALSASTLDFKTVVVGQTVNQTLTVTNSGQSPVQLTGLAISNKEFAITGPSVPRTILPANSLTYTISFAPTTSGSATGTLQISSDAQTTANSIALSGSGEKAYADLVLTPNIINFGNLTVKSKSTQNVTIQNKGDVTVTIQGITMVGAGFGYSISPGFSLAPNQGFSFQVWFTPTKTGAASATVSFLSPNLSSPETMSLTGDGVSSSSAGGGGSTPPPPPASHTVHLTWAASTSSVAGYRVYRSEVGGTFTALNGTLLNILSYDDDGVSLGTTYYYVVTAVDGSGNESVHSNQVTAVIPST
ncbi:MAG TPA: choice-of-anchor D domain-containing protein [Dongiaceae bacterium]|nr:choice-of-anchor D domain-containing protein [Dongiaceae bacterium]